MRISLALRLIYLTVFVLAALVGWKVWAQQSSLRAAPQTLAAMAYGPEDAKVTVVEFMDYRCAACRKAHSVMMQATEEFPDVRFTFRHLPVFGKPSVVEAQMAQTAARHGRFREMHEILINRENAVQEEEILTLAAQARLDTNSFRDEMRQPDNAEIMYKTLDIAKTLHIDQTPAYIIGNRVFIPRGAPVTIEDLRREINAARGGQ